MMQILLSPAKTLDFESEIPLKMPSSTPHFLKEAQNLVGILKNYSAKDLAALMNISPAIADLNRRRFAQWSADSQNTRAAIFAFNGDVYEGLNAKTLKNPDFAQDHLRILCGLYGVLKPFDGILPYRLEMKTRLKNQQGKDLYAFWHCKIADFLELEAPHCVVNLASNEYFKSVSPFLKSPVVNCVFEDEKNGVFKTISFYAKRARGLMARFIIENRLTKPADLRDFCAEGYQFCDNSTEELLIFRRNEHSRH